MKKILFMISLGLLTASCEKNPDYNELDGELVVYTDYDKACDFGAHRTYFLPDSIRTIKGHEATYWKDENADLLIKEVAKVMDSRGYVRITDANKKDSADLGVQMSYLTETNIIWGSNIFNGWWDYGYWGPWWNGWYYPYSIAYTYNTNTLIMEILDLTKKQPKEQPQQKIPVVWYTHSYGYQYSALYNAQFLLKGIDQAFEQSPYIKSEK